MPEGPEIRRSADAIGAVLANQRLIEVELGLPKLKPYYQELVGQKVLRVTSWGKAMLIHLENAITVYSHNQLYGVWQVSKKGQQPETSRSLRLALHTKTHSAVLYSASDISIWPTQRITEQPLLSKLGPDILDGDVTDGQLAKRLKSNTFRRRKLSALYLNQHFIAGIGNYLRSEILFCTGIHPDKTPAQLNDEQIMALSHASIEVSQRSYQTGGYTVYGDLYERALATKADYEESRFMVFDREGLPCRDCATPIQRIERNGRRLYWCSVCQKP